MDKRLYWLWLQSVLGYAGESKPLLDIFGTARNFYEAGDSAWAEFFCDRKKAYKNCSAKSPQDFRHIVDFCDEHRLEIVTPDSEYYPKNLLDVENLPVALFVRGDYKCFNESDTFGVIGSRTPCVYGENAAKNIVADLACRDILIVSGGAVGIDSIAHKTAMNSGGKTVLVMGCGHGYDYLPENADLRKKVTKQGAVISEYPPFTAVSRGSFPQRNRIISGMSKAVVIIEAAEYSGTFSTARHAKKQGREIFVLPGDIESGNFAGSNRLVTEGARAIFSGADILVAAGLLDESERFNGKKTGNVFECIDEKSKEGKSYIRKPSKKKLKVEEENKTEEKIQKKTENIIKNLPAGISKNAEIVYNIMSDGVNDLDEIKRKAQLEVRYVLVALTELEILGFAENCSPGCYRVK